MEMSAAPPNTPPPRTCWVLTEGHAGMEGQCLGLAENIGLTPQIKRVSPKAPWIWLPARLWPNPLGMAAPETPLTPPWPDVLISCGRRSAAAAAAIKRQSGKATLAIHLQRPPLPPQSFDAIIVPEHDNYSGPNVMTMRGSLHRLTDEKLEQARAAFAPRFAALGNPKIGVLVGGSNKRQDFTPALARDFAGKLHTAQQALPGSSLLLTPSRRTGKENESILREALSGTHNFIWDGTGENPYFGIMALADHLVVTGDSVNMVSEACFTGKPVYIYLLPGGSKRLQSFTSKLIAEGFARPFAGALEPFAPPRLDEMAAVVKTIKDRFGL